eukprot:2012763-Pleurochrysis_carterae.AAC.1
MTQEVDVLRAAAEVMQEGARDGQVVTSLSVSALSVHIKDLRARKFSGPRPAGSKRAGPHRLACEVLRIAQL